MKDAPRSLQDTENRNRAAGFHFFDADTKRFFGSRILQTFYTGPGGSFFVTSEHTGLPPTTERAYTVRRAQPDGQIDTMPPHTNADRNTDTGYGFLCYSTAARAATAARFYAANPAPSEQDRYRPCTHNPASSCIRCAPQEFPVSEGGAVPDADF